MDIQEEVVIAETFAKHVKECYKRFERAEFTVDKEAKIAFDAQLSVLWSLAKDLASLLENADPTFNSSYFLLGCGFKNTVLVKREEN